MPTTTKIDDMHDPAARIRALNDRLRTTGGGGQVFVTPGVAALPMLNLVLEALMAFDAFDADNDSYGEHDFGAFDVQGQRLLFKIDYYDLGLRFHSPDPADPTVTRRVLTLMLPDEY